jgi:hypothetical protein
MKPIMDLVHLQHIEARPPPPEEVAKGLKTVFAQRDARYEDFYITITEIGFKYLQEHPKEDGSSWLSASDVQTIFETLQRPPDSGGKAHLSFGRLLDAEVTKAFEAKRSGSAKDNWTGVVDVGEKLEEPYLLHLLCLYGCSAEARELATAFRGPFGPDDGQKMQLANNTWTRVLSGFAREGNAEELLRTAVIMRELNVPFTQSMQDVIVPFFAEKRDLEQAKYWYSQPVVGTHDLKPTEPSGKGHTAILKACALNGDFAFGQQVVASLLKTMPMKPAWDAIFVWSAATGKGVDEVARMMDVMVRRGDEARQKDTSLPILRPDVDTINALVELSILRQDSYSAERYITLGEKRGIHPDAATFTMQMQYRLAANDIDGARAAYFGLEGVKNETSATVTNQLVRAMCESKQHHFDDIMAIVDDLHEQKARLEPETVATLCILHLRRGEIHDAMDIIQVHAHHYTPQQRQIIQKSLIEFLLDRQNSTADAWDTYQMLRSVFPEIPRDTRIQIMNEFFARERSDMACHVFFHMRNHTNELITANRDVYIDAFTGFARNADAESLELAHNQLKLDLNTDLDTKLRNSLMLAYAATGNNRKALEYWAEIVASKEGPTYNSIAIAFRSCEGMPFGDQHARPIWQRLKEMDIDIDKQLFTAYLGALARNQLHDEVVGMLETAEEEYGFQPDFFV